MDAVTKYESAFGEVTLSPKTVRDYLVKGSSNVTDQEVVLFIEMCKAQKLNPFVTGEVYLIKFGTSAAQMVVGYDTYKRRAEENPAYLYKKSGIIVQRNTEIVKKEGACLYPAEALIGGWCEVHKSRGTLDVITYKEVSMQEYDKKNSMWKEKPATMIEKVAISQALREAFPKDFEGLYTREEITEFEEGGKEEKVADVIITQEQRHDMFATAPTKYGNDWRTKLMELVKSYGYNDTTSITVGDYEKIMAELKTIDVPLDEPTNEPVKEPVEEQAKEPEKQ